MSGAADYDSSFIAEALPAFISEAQEQIETIEQLMLQLEDQPEDRELLDALFRCAHTVKGSAGIFGLDAVVAFTHHVETLLDRLRDGALQLTPGLSTLLLQCNDQIRTLIAAALDPGAEAGDAAQIRAGLVLRLQAASGQAAPAAQAAAAASAAPVAAVGRWDVAVQFGIDTFRNGMDPLAILGYVAGLGAVPRIAALLDQVPPLGALDPESCHLGFDFSLDTAAGQAEIEAAFSFVREDCTLSLTPPRDAAQSGPAQQGTRLGELLVDAGAVTQQQLGAALRHQADTLHDTGQALQIGAILQAAHGVEPRVVDAALQKQTRQRAASAAAGADDQRYIRVHADRLDAVINLLGELVTASAGGLLLARQSRDRGLVEANHQISALVEEIRNGTLQLRMVPIGETFSRFRRVVRDTAAELDKDVALEIQGGETELDKSVVERIADPLMHLVRNALDHGLETPAQRLAAGKPAQGRLTLSARHESGSILIRIQDDGRGIAVDKVLARAWERGLLAPGVTPPEADILKLIFEPGFSTAEKVTNLSGRGVGMDVVRRNIEALRGTVTVFSDPGQGSCIEIRMPLTLAIIDGFLIGVGPSKFIFPLDAVVEVIERRTSTTAPDARGRSMVELRGQVLPVLSLRALYGLESTEPERSSVVVVRAGASRFGVVVDQLLGQHQTVIKPLGRMLRSLRGMAGSSILGNGEVALIFDVVSLAQLAAQQPAAGSARAGPGTLSPPALPTPIPLASTEGPAP